MNALTEGGFAQVRARDVRPFKFGNDLDQYENGMCARCL